MNIYLCCPVRLADEELKKKLEEYVVGMEALGHSVHYPARDTKQDDTGFNICMQNTAAIAWCDEMHIWFDPKSTGSHFDLGVAFALAKPIKVIHNVEPLPEGKSFARMIKEWEDLSYDDGGEDGDECSCGDCDTPCDEKPNPSSILHLV